jgi:hypothetical protein
MGDGAIDGRGGAKLLGQDVTWWDLAKQAKVMDLAQSVPRMMVVRRLRTTGSIRDTACRSAAARRAG